VGVSAGIGQVQPVAPVAPAGLRELGEDAWRYLERAHQDRVDTVTRDHLSRRSRGVEHPVEDFLFRYYAHRPGRLRRWHPGAGAALVGGRERAGWSAYRYDGRIAYVDVVAFLATRAPLLRSTRDLLSATAGRPAQLGCFGMHEWAMVYRHLGQDSQPAVRHPAWPLRLGAQGTDAVVESHALRCTHFDAYRFFTPAAEPLNSVAPRADSRTDLEQPGCLHATMDVYKLAYRLGPVVPSALVMDCFDLAREVREVDMRASPYDLRALGYPPIPVETPTGKAQYVAAQRRFAERARPLRQRLIEVCDRLLATAG
jgi:hypothetical protein